jgi:hypothetical protein
MTMELDRAKVILNADWCRELVPGTAYYMVHYFEPGVNIPEIETYVYLGQSKFEGEDAIAYVFQRASSYCEIGDYGNLAVGTRPPSINHLLSCSKDSIGGIADIDGLMVLIQGLARRMKLGIGWDRVIPDE